jgi:hypothetical protein
MGDSEEELTLVIKCLQEGISNCIIWHEKGARLVREDDELRELTPEFIRREVIRHVRVQNNPAAVVRQIRERRSGWEDRYRFYYKVILPVDGFKHGVFVEMRLTDDDPEIPVVTLVRAHTQKR